MSRELDARVATVLGLDVVGEGWAHQDPELLHWWHPTSAMRSGNELQPMYLAHCVCGLYADEEPDEWTPDKMLGHYPGCLEVVAFYSERIEVAWPVVEWMDQHEHQDFHLSRIRKGDPCFYPHMSSYLSYRATFGRELGGTYAYGSSAPHAICLAFLAAMGKERRK